MHLIEDKDKITISFTGKLDNGTVFIEVTPQNPMVVRLGESELPPSVEMAMIGMEKGENKKIRVSFDEGYGPRLKDLLHEISLETFGDRIDPKPGMVLSQTIVKDGVEQKVPVTVIEIKDRQVVLDYNHPLAGHHLTYDLTVIDIEK